LEHLSYVEAVERLAQQAGVPLRYEGDSPAERRAARRRQSLIRANEEAARLYAIMLQSGREASQARAYLEERGIPGEAIAEFQIGYAPGYPDFLLRRLSDRLGPEVLLEAGLASRGDDGTVRDRFRGRITFPIHDLQSRAIGFGARILPGDSKAGELAKYLNTAETPIYRKHEVLYNLNRARGSIAKSGEVFVVEGYTDVIGLVQAGIDNVVATCGTALGEGHFRLLSRFARRAVLAFDSDEAGARAAERAFSFQEQFPVQVHVMILPEGLDPADLVAKRGADAVREAAAGARPLVEYMVHRAVDRHDLSSVEGQSSAVAEALPMLERLQDPVRRTEYAHLLADLAGVDDASVLQSLQRRLGGRPQEVAKTVKRTTARDRLEREMLRLMVRDIATFVRYAPRLSTDHFRNPRHRSVFVALERAGGNVQLIVSGPDDRMAATISALAVEPLEGEPGEGYAEQVWTGLQEFLLKSRSEILRLKLQKLNPTTDEGYDALFRELVGVDGDLRRLRQEIRDPM
jgi:DNA primase